MRPRSLARRLAFQYLFMYEQNGGDCEQAVYFFKQNTEVDTVIDFAKKLVETTLERLLEIDDLVAKSAQNYEIGRIAVAERNLLRLAIAEIIVQDTPFKVVIDESLKLARKFGGKDSVSFVNGILDNVAKELKVE